MVKIRNGKPVNKFGSHRGWFYNSKLHAECAKGHKVKKTTTERRMDFIKGGLADNIPASAFDQEQLKKGMKVEMEHTNNPKIAEEIAKDHIFETGILKDGVYYSDYYSELKKLEKKLEKKNPK